MNIGKYDQIPAFEAASFLSLWCPNFHILKWHFRQLLNLELNRFQEWERENTKEPLLLCYCPVSSISALFLYNQIYPLESVKVTHCAPYLSPLPCLSCIQPEASSSKGLWTVSFSFFIGHLAQYLAHGRSSTLISKINLFISTTTSDVKPG